MFRKPICDGVHSYTKEGAFAVPNSKDFDLTNPIVVVRLMAGLFYVPHVLFKITGFAGSLTAFGNMGFQPPLFWVSLAILTELICARGLRHVRHQGRPLDVEFRRDRVHRILGDRVSRPGGACMEGGGESGERSRTPHRRDGPRVNRPAGARTGSRPKDREPGRLCGADRRKAAAAGASLRIRRCILISSRLIRATACPSKFSPFHQSPLNQGRTKPAGCTQRHPGIYASLHGSDVRLRPDRSWDGTPC